jgi:hypothetical protein
MKLLTFVFPLRLVVQHASYRRWLAEQRDVSTELIKSQGGTRKVVRHDSREMDVLGYVLSEKIYSAPNGYLTSQAFNAKFHQS